jgi:hypothetical protein
VPTAEQAIQCVVKYQSITNLFQSIHIVRLDERTNNIFILADGGEDGEIGLEIFPDGNWGFIHED